MAANQSASTCLGSRCRLRWIAIVSVCSVSYGTYPCVAVKEVNLKSRGEKDFQEKPSKKSLSLTKQSSHKHKQASQRLSCLVSLSLILLAGTVWDCRWEVRSEKRWEVFKNPTITRS
jgi:uncharacterized ion transporter superfamily protein YfcC